MEVTSGALTPEPLVRGTVAGAVVKSKLLSKAKMDDWGPSPGDSRIKKTGTRVVGNKRPTADGACA